MSSPQLAEAASERWFERRNPISDEVVTRALAFDVERARASADAAAAAFPAWSTIGPNERRAKLARSADVLERRADDFVPVVAAETAMTDGWVRFNVRLAANMLREAAAMTTQITGEVIPSDKPGTFAMALRKPAGVVLGLAPWNAPIILGIRAIAMPLACGNTTILKASELCPRTHQLLGEVMEEAGMGPGVVNVVTNAVADAPAVVEALIAHPAVRRVNFTGSTRVGRTIAELCARSLKPALLELGGKAPLVVLDDADVGNAVDAAIFGSFLNQGQICMSTERIIVDEKIADEFVERLARRAEALTTGDPSTGHFVLGGVIGRDAAERIESLVVDATQKGAKLAAGGRRVGTLMEATVVDGITSAMRIYHEESFGPVVTVIRVRSADEAIRVANDTEYGLSSAVFGRDVARALDVAQRIDAGICHINGPTVHDEAQMPFGGVKGSGYGRFGGKAAVAEFTDLRWITLEGPQHYPF
ncbi:MAG: aldehyde dehydrogenase [Candidatus Eremiobacteraeota bacterium]|nr:aldehyde dehydrogenase [Candidatus Eremiobacteraeota bacterium]